jgi:hypothetical protein
MRTLSWLALVFVQSQKLPPSSCCYCKDGNFERFKTFWIFIPNFRCIFTWFLQRWYEGTKGHSIRIFWSLVYFLLPLYLVFFLFSCSLSLVDSFISFIRSFLLHPFSISLPFFPFALFHSFLLPSFLCPYIYLFLSFSLPRLRRNTVIRSTSSVSSVRKVKAAISEFEVFTTVTLKTVFLDIASLNLEDCYRHFGGSSS